MSRSDCIHPSSVRPKQIFHRNTEYRNKDISKTEYLQKQNIRPKWSSFCRNAQVSAETRLFLPNLTYICKNDIFLHSKSMSTTNFLDLMKLENVVIFDKNLLLFAETSPFLPKEAHFCRNTGVSAFLPKECYDQKSFSAR